MRPIVPFIVVAIFSFVVANAAQLILDPSTRTAWDLVLDEASSPRMVGAICMPMLVCVALLHEPKSFLHFTASVFGFVAFFTHPILDLTLTGAAFGSTWFQLLELIALAASLSISATIATFFIAFSRPTLNVQGRDLKRPAVGIWHLIIVAVALAITFFLISYVSSPAFQKSRSPFNALAILRVGQPVALCIAMSILINLLLIARGAKNYRKAIQLGIVLTVVIAGGCMQVAIERAWQAATDLYSGVNFFWDGLVLPILGATLILGFLFTVSRCGFEASHHHQQ